MSFLFCFVLFSTIMWINISVWIIDVFEARQGVKRHDKRIGIWKRQKSFEWVLWVCLNSFGHGLFCQPLYAQFILLTSTFIQFIVRDLKRLQADGLVVVFESHFLQCLIYASDMLRPTIFFFFEYIYGIQRRFGRICVILKTHRLNLV